MNIIETLPTELVVAIAERIDLPDVQAFVLTCRAFHRCRSQHMREHARLIAKYSNYDATSFRRSLQLLDDAFTPGFKAEYVKTLSIGPFAPAEPGQATHVLPEQFPALLRRLTRWRFLVSRRRNWRMPPGLVQLLTSGGGDSVAALLTFPLPYLSTIVLDGGGQEPWGRYQFYESIRNIAWKSQNAGVFPNSPRYLPKLSHVVYHGQKTSTGPRNGTWLEPIQYFAGITSVKSITITNARSPFCFRASLNRGGLQCPNVLELYVEGGPIMPFDFSHLLEEFKNLHVLSFVGRFDDWPNQERYRFSGSPCLARKLLDNAGAGLRHLTLRYKSVRPKYMGELQEFMALRTLEIDLNILVPEEDLENPSAITNAIPRTLEGFCVHVFCGDQKGGSFIALMQSLLSVAATGTLAKVKVFVQADPDFFDSYCERVTSATASRYKAEGKEFAVELSANSFVEEDESGEDEI